MTRTRFETRDDLGLLQAVLASEVSRSDAVAIAALWRPQDLSSPSTSADAVLSNLDVGDPATREQGPPYFLRDCDLQEWVLLLQEREEYRRLEEGIVQFRISPPAPTWMRGRMLPLLACSLTEKQLCERLDGLVLVRGFEPGLGFCADANLLVSGELVHIQSLRFAEPQQAVSIYVKERSGAAFDQFRCIIDTLSLDDEEITWVHQSCGLAQQRRWRVVRQDDNGNSFEVTTRLSRARAVRIAEEFEARGHKQWYSVLE